MLVSRSFSLTSYILNFYLIYWLTGPHLFLALVTHSRVARGEFLQDFDVGELLPGNLVLPLDHTLLVPFSSSLVRLRRERALASSLPYSGRALIDRGETLLEFLEFLLFGYFVGI